RCPHRVATSFPARRSSDLGWYRIVGHKWFLSVPTADAHLVLALLDGAPTCFYVPRWAPDGHRNSVRFMQLKNKLGNRANASAEVDRKSTRLNSSHVKT